MESLRTDLQVGLPKQSQWGAGIFAVAFCYKKLDLGKAFYRFYSISRALLQSWLFSRE